MGVKNQMIRCGLTISTVLLTATAVCGHSGMESPSEKPAALSSAMPQAAAPAPTNTAPLSATPFAAATLAPADVTAFIHVDQASRIRKEIADRPIARWVASVLKNGQFAAAWHRLAQSANLRDEDLFDFAVGERFTLLIRVTKDADNSFEWALITGVNSERATEILRTLRVRVREPRADFAIAELPEEDILLGRDEHHLVVGPIGQSKLFYEVLPRLRDRNQPSLADEPFFASAGELGQGCAGAFFRHSADMGGGWSCMVANLKGDQLAIRHAGHFSASPFMRGMTKLCCDCSPVKSFEQRSLVATIEPTDIGDGPVESFLSATLHDGLVSKSMRDNVGDRRLMVIGEEDVRLAQKQFRIPTDGRKPVETPPAVVQMPTLVTCIELKDKDIAPDQLDWQMERLTRHINELGQGSFLVEVPFACRFKPGEPRHIDLAPAMEGFGGGFPVMKGVSLNWTIADGPNGSWFVIATHPQSMNEVVKMLKAGSEKDARFVGRFESAGTANGQRIGRHMENWSEQAADIAPPGKAESLKLTLKLMSQLAAGMQTCRWQMSRPTEKDVRLDVQVTLSPPESTR